MDSSLRRAISGTTGNVRLIRADDLSVLNASRTSLSSVATSTSTDGTAQKNCVGGAVAGSRKPPSVERAKKPGRAKAATFYQSSLPHSSSSAHNQDDSFHQMPDPSSTVLNSFCKTSRNRGGDRQGVTFSDSTDDCAVKWKILGASTVTADMDSSAASRTSHRAGNRNISETVRPCTTEKRETACYSVKQETISDILVIDDSDDDEKDAIRKR